MKIRRFEDLEVWQTAREMTRRVYEVSRRPDFRRDFGLVDQMRRASVSVMSNVAEGFESRTDRLFIDFLGRAKGSAGELRCQVYVAKDAGYLTDDDFDELLEQATSCGRQLHALIGYLKAHPRAEPRVGEQESDFYDSVGYPTYDPEIDPSHRP